MFIETSAKTGYNVKQVGRRHLVLIPSPAWPKGLVTRSGQLARAPTHHLMGSKLQSW